MICDCECLLQICVVINTKEVGEAHNIGGYSESEVIVSGVAFGHFKRDQTQFTDFYVKCEIIDGKHNLSY